MSSTYKTDQSFFTYVKPPSNYIGIKELVKWFNAASTSKYRLIVDQELDEEFATLEKVENFYPGIKTFAVAINPWARPVVTYADLKRIEHPLSKYAQGSFDDFVRSMEQAIEETPNSYFALPQISWFEYKDSDNAVKSVTHIFKAESLESDFKILQDFFETTRGLEWVTEIPEYKDLYTTETKKIISKYFQEDIDRFAYSF